MPLTETFFSPTAALSLSMMAGVISLESLTSSTFLPRYASSILLMKALVGSSLYLLGHLVEDLPPYSSALSAAFSTSSSEPSVSFTATVLRSGTLPAMVNPAIPAQSETKAAMFLRGMYMVGESGQTQAPVEMPPNSSSATAWSSLVAPVSAMMASSSSRSRSTNSSAPSKAMTVLSPLKEICRGLSEGLWATVWKTFCILSTAGNS